MSINFIGMIMNSILSKFVETNRFLLVLQVKINAHM